MCGEEKDASEFGDPTRCRPCMAMKSRAYHRANGDRSRAGFRNYFRSRKLPAPLVWIYEFWSADGRCLYVGKTDNLHNRMRFHRNSENNGGRGYRERAYTVLRMAEDPEVRVIQELRPLYNNVGN